MFSALDSDKQLVDIDTAISNPNEQYYCCSCEGELIIKNGNVRVPHFAHKTCCDCDGFDNDMSEWHRNWQKRFPIRNREVVLRMDAESPFAENYKKTVRRTDALCYGYAIEFQNSAISSEEFDERSCFYNNMGYKVVWIFNMIEQYKNDKIRFIEEWSRYHDNGGKYKWNYASKTFVNYDSSDKEVTLIFQMSDVDDREEDSSQCYFERITWAINCKSEYLDTDFKHFCTSYCPSNFTELMKYLKNKRL